MLLPLAGSLGLLTAAGGAARDRARRPHHAGRRRSPRRRSTSPSPAAARGQPEPEPDELRRAPAGRVLVDRLRPVRAGRQSGPARRKALDVTVIDKNVERIRAAARFGFRVYYGDGTRLDVLRAAGAARREIDLRLRRRPRSRPEDRRDRPGGVPAGAHLRARLRPHPRDRSDEAARSTTSSARPSNSALRFGRAALEELGVQEARRRRRSERRAPARHRPPRHAEDRKASWAAPTSCTARASQPEPLTRPDGKAARPLARNPRHHRRGRARWCLTQRRRARAPPDRDRRASSSAPTMRHVVVMTGDGLGRARSPSSSSTSCRCSTFPGSAIRR